MRSAAGEKHIGALGLGLQVGGACISRGCSECPLLNKLLEAHARHALLSR